MPFLTSETEKIFEIFSKENTLSLFTFVGGSALASYLEHRLSEDLDFFTWTENLPIETDQLINKLINDHKVEIVNRSRQNTDLLIDNVKVTFFANNWSPLEQYRRALKEKIYAADLELLCAMKTNTISLRGKFRDYYDLYVLNKEKFDIREMFNISAKFLPGLTKKVFAMQITFIEDIEDESIQHLSPKYKVTLEEIQNHFTKEMRRL